MTDHKKEFHAANDKANRAFAQAVYTATTDGIAAGFRSERKRVRDLVDARMGRAVARAKVAAKAGYNAIEEQKLNAIAWAMQGILKDIDDPCAPGSQPREMVQRCRRHSLTDCTDTVCAVDPTTPYPPAVRCEHGIRKPHECGDCIAAPHGCPVETPD